MRILASQDTDSLFTKDESGLIKDLVDDKELGKFKDELGGETLEEATFLGIKQYGYWYNENGVRKERSIFAGFTIETYLLVRLLSIIKVHTSSLICIMFTTAKTLTYLSKSLVKMLTTVKVFLPASQYRRYRTNNLTIV